MQNAVVSCCAFVFNIGALAVEDVLFGQSPFWRVEEIHFVAILDPVWDGADSACLLTSRHGLVHLCCPVVTRARHRVAKEESMTLEVGPFFPELLGVQPSYHGHVEHSLTVFRPVTMNFLAMFGKGVFADEAFMAQFADHWSCHEGLTWSFHQRGWRDAW